MSEFFLLGCDTSGSVVQLGVVGHVRGYNKEGGGKPCRLHKADQGKRRRRIIDRTCATLAAGELLRAAGMQTSAT